MKRLISVVAVGLAGLAAVFAVPAFAGGDVSVLMPQGGELSVLALGMLITPDNLRSLQQGFNAAFSMGFTGVKATWGQIAMLIPSTTKTENYGWLKDFPGMREWIGQRQINNLETAAAQLTNKTWEHTIGVNVDDIADDQLGIYTPMFQMQGETVARHPDELVWGLLPTGFAVKGFDGQYFFDTDHVGYTAAGAEASWSNTGGGAGAPWFLMDLSRNYMKPLIFQERQKAVFVAMNRPNDQGVFMENKALYGAKARYIAGFGFHQLAYGSKATLDATSFKAARTALETQHRSDGSPLPVKATHLVCGPSRRDEAEAVLVEKLAGGATNPLYRAVELIVDSSLG